MIHKSDILDHLNLKILQGGKDMQADNPGAEVSESKDLERDGWERFERTYAVEEVKAKLHEHAGSWFGDGPGPWTDAGTLAAYGPLAAVRDLWLADAWSAGYATARGMKAIMRDATARFAGSDDADKVEVRGWVHREVRVAPAPTIIGPRDEVEAGRRRVAAEVARERHAEQAAKAGTADATPVFSMLHRDKTLHSARLLELVRDYGLQERADGGSTRDPRSRAAEAIFNDIVRLVRFGTPHPPVVSPEETPTPPAVVAAEPSTGSAEGVGNPQSLSEALRWLRGREGRHNESVTKRLDSGESVNDPAIRYLMGKADGLAQAARVFEAVPGRMFELRVTIAPCPTCKATFTLVNDVIRGRAVVHVTGGEATATAHLRGCWRLAGTPCCELHGPRCEPPGELCCRWCVEADHPTHAGDTLCVLAVDHG